MEALHPETRAQRFFRSYGDLLCHVCNWAAYGTILVLALTWGRTVTPSFHEFSPRDIRLQHSYRNELQISVPIYSLALLSALLPFGCFVAVELYEGGTAAGSAPARSPQIAPLPEHQHSSNTIWKLFQFATCLLGSQATQLLVVCVLKNICGLPRPDMLSRCQPNMSLAPESGVSLSDITICTSSNFSLLREGFRSFPSGHSSTIFTSATIMTYYNSKKFFNDQRDFLGAGIIFKSFIILGPTVVAVYVGFTRVKDNRHFILDVVVGAVIGVFVGVYYMRLMYSKL